MQAASSKDRRLSATEGETWVELGRVLRPHGRTGALLVGLHGDDPANLSAAPNVRLSGRVGRVVFPVQRAAAMAPLKDGRARVRLQLEGLTRREAAEHWAGAALEIPQAGIQPLPEGEFYWREILGLRARGPRGQELGVVEEIWPTGSNDVLVLRSAERQILVPALREVLVRVDLEAGELWIDPPRGLLNEED